MGKGAGDCKNRPAIGFGSIPDETEDSLTDIENSADDSDKKASLGSTVYSIEQLVDKLSDNHKELLRDIGKGNVYLKIKANGQEQSVNTAQNAKIQSVGKEIKSLKRQKLCFFNKTTKKYVLTKKGKETRYWLFPEDKPTGNKFEEEMKTLAESNGYFWESKKPIAEVPYLKNKTDKPKMYETDGLIDGNIIVEMKYQDSPGTAEEKLLYKIIAINRIINNYPQYKKAYLVMGGHGWTLGRYEETVNFIEEYDIKNIQVVWQEEFTSLVEQKKL